MIFFVGSILNSQPVSPDNIVFIVHVYDSTSKVPLQSAEVTLIKNQLPLVTIHTNVTGRAVFRDVEPGKYKISIYNIGYQIFNDSILLTESNT
jgi:5-hydroxyisourate hydrolase-like protein (transthyretin family)